ncbi:MAG TPA: AraC family transcriptional regulator [Steroidobacteraceae bacterium]|jgi:AraC family transcriptional regulator
MNPVNRAIWYVERHFARELTLDEIAEDAGVTRYHLTRAFGAVTGRSLMRYVRGRRLTEAARALVNGAPDILAVALEAGYGSHEAFTRAFTDQFGITPESLRAQGHLNNIELVEAIRMDQTPLSNLQPPRFVDGKPLLLAGLSERYECETSAGIPAQWQRFLPSFGHIPGQRGRVAYGVNYNGDDAGNFDYLCGVEVTDFSKVPEHFTRLRVPANRYAVFAHREHISTIRRTWHTIWTQWLPASGHEVADAPLLERYGEEFDARSGNGGLEIWIPLK